MTRTRIIVWALGAVCFCTLGAGCSHSPATPATHAPSPVLIVFDVVGPKPLAATDFSVTAVNRPGHAHAPFMSGEIDLTMPGMSMPPNVVRLKTVSPGHFSGTGTFTMAGKWTAAVHLTMQDGKTIDQSFPVSL